MYLKGSDNREKEQVHFALGEGLEEGRAAASADDSTSYVLSLRSFFVCLLVFCLFFFIIKCSLNISSMITGYLNS